MVNNNYSCKIGAGAFFCALEIVAFHAPGSWANTTFAADWLYRLVAPLTQAALAFFFAVAGYFVWSKILDGRTYLQVVGKRFRTLIVPFVLWNLIFFSCVWLMYVCLANMGRADEFISLMPGGAERWRSLDAISFIRNCPNPVLWFLRTLFVLILISPLLMWGVGRIKLLFVMLLGGGCLAIETLHVSLPLATLVQPRAVFYFTLGLWWHRQDSQYPFRKCMSICLLVVGYALSFCSPSGHLLLMLGYVGVLPAWPNGRQLQSYAFPLYMIHYPMIWLFLFLNALCGWVTTGTVLWVLLTGVFALMMSLSVIVVMRRLCPRVCSVLFGGR